MLGMTRRRMRAEMMSSEFTDWMAYLHLLHDDAQQVLSTEGVQPVVVLRRIEGL